MARFRNVTRCNSVTSAGGFRNLTASLAKAALMLVFACTGQAVLAQAGQVAPPTRDELNPPQAREVARRDSVTLTIDGEMERAPCALDDPRYADISLTLNNVSFVGVEAAPEVSLAPAYQSYLGQELPLSVLCDIRAQARQILRSKGYLAVVEIPEQRLSDGNAEMRVVFGRLSAVRVRGDAGKSEQLVARYLEKLTEQDIFNTKDAERYLLLADDIPGTNVRLSLRAAADGEPGDLVGEIAVLRQSGAIDFNVQNYGSRSLGRVGGILRGEVYDLIGQGDRTSLSFFTTADPSEQNTVQFAHDFRVGGEGLTLGGQVTYSTTNPDLNLTGFDVESETVFSSIRASYPLVRGQTKSSFLSSGFDFVDQNVEVNEIPLSRDRVRMAYARLDMDWTDRVSIDRIGGYTPYEPRQRLVANVEVRQGFDVFHASPDCRGDLLSCFAGGAVPPSRIEADPTPFLLRGSAIGELRPVLNIAFVLRTDFQITDDPLPAFEEFAAGTYSIGRGYNPGAVLGDSGLGLSTEMRFGSIAPDDFKSLAWQPYVFSDVAWAWNKDPSRQPGNPDNLWSIGAGLRFAYGASLFGDLTVAVPLERPDLSPQRGDVRVLFSVTTRLLPWRF